MEWLQTMNNFVLAGVVVPHPPIMVPEIGKDQLSDISDTTKAMDEIAKEISQLNPQTLVFISPHSPSASEAFALKGDRKLIGSFNQFGFPELKYQVENDYELVEEIEKVASKFDVPTLIIGGEEGVSYSQYPLDHGILAPFSYIDNVWKGKIVSISISNLDFKHHYKFGEIIRISTNNLERKIVFVASGDLSHRLIPDAPAGYSPIGKDFDKIHYLDV